jgi:micrococcal nuclease
MSAPGHAPPGSPCAECDCPGLDPGQSGVAAFCAACGHPAEAHRPPVPPVRPCLDCTCAAFEEGGSNGARFCAACGHASERHESRGRKANGSVPATEYGLRIETAGTEHGLSADREAPLLRVSEAAAPDVPAPPTPPPAPVPPAFSPPVSAPRDGDRRGLRIALIGVAIAAAAVVVVAGIVLFVSSLGSSSTAVPLSPGPVSTTPKPGPDEVAKVIDGTTFRLGSGERVKLAQIDAPKVPSHDCYAANAVTELGRLLPVGTAVTLRPEPKLAKVDKFGRRVAYAFVGKTNVNLAMVKRGAAAPYFFFGRRGRYAAELLRAGTTARRAGLGLWSACPNTILDAVHQVHTRS